MKSRNNQCQVEGLLLLTSVTGDLLVDSTRMWKFTDNRGIFQFAIFDGLGGCNLSNFDALSFGMLSLSLLMILTILIAVLNAEKCD